MGGAVRGVLAFAAAAAVVAGTASCGQTVDGNAVAVGAGGGGINTNFDKLLRECEVVSDDKIAETAGGAGSYANDSFFGAVCMWDLEGSATGMVTLNWYENGNLRNERLNNDKLGYSTSSITVQGALALEVRRPNDPDSCGVSASAADTGVVGWWINYRAGSTHPDPCGAAKTLVEMTLNLAR
ncbi:DUF3558 domain-containing protein [Nocardia bovistercoris]|uniref:DUF3558 domain-containing protein n=1 Tax=Nocardia bovistercoris TaxID=2785916 RepID=A0A931N6P7_9NOCA|nr:DUF3558 domain-containing protein [Nocardia bovistercoris]MBH0780967.1 DUF3558 domain-containing protein [Nocardia bovistercoris]